MRIQTVLAFAALATSLTAGCAADDASTSDSNVTSYPDGLSADVNTGSLKQTVGKCSVDLKTVDIRLANADVAKRINDAIRFDVQKALESSGQNCTIPLTITGNYAISYNRWNLLSVVFSEYFDVEGAAHPSHDLRTWNFDLRTGDPMRLSETLDPEGLAVAVDACKSEPGNDAFADACESSVRDNVWRIESGGIRIHPVAVPFVAWEIAERGVELTWMYIGGHFTQPALQAIAP